MPSNSTMTDFEAWYVSYPKKVARKDALKAWNQLKPDAALQQKMHDTLRWQLQTPEWKRGIGIPYPATWIRGERWTDQPPPQRTVTPVPIGTDRQREAWKQIQALIAQGMDRREAILQVENELFPSEAPHGHTH